MVIKRYQKFVGWIDDKAYFKNATLWDRIRAWCNHLFMDKPNIHNLILDFKEAEEILAQARLRKHAKHKR